MLVVAMTGGIGSGKSAVSNRFEALHVPVIDADILAREQVLPGSAALQEIKALFGSQVIQPDGSLNREALRSLVFDSHTARQHLEQILHPRIRKAMQDRLNSLHTPYAILVIPLLLETGQQELADRILVVDCPETLQISRVQQRDGMSEAQIKKILAAQISRSSRLSAADDVIDNSGSLQELIDSTDRLHQHYLQLAKSTP